MPWPLIRLFHLMLCRHPCRHTSFGQCSPYWRFRLSDKRPCNYLQERNAFPDYAMAHLRISDSLRAIHSRNELPAYSLCLCSSCSRYKQLICTHIYSVNPAVPALYTLRSSSYTKISFHFCFETSAAYTLPSFMSSMLFSISASNCSFERER